MGDPGLKLLGFKPSSLMKDYHQAGHRCETREGERAEGEARYRLGRKGNVGLQLLGFKPSSLMKDYHQAGHRWGTRQRWGGKWRRGTGWGARATERRVDERRGGKSGGKGIQSLKLLGFEPSSLMKDYHQAGHR